MKIENRSNYRTDDLRKLCLAGLKSEGMDHRGYVIEIRNRRGGTNCVTGRASYYRKWVRLNIPIHSEHHLDPLPIRVARVLVHEIAHNRGVRHGDLEGGRYCAKFDVPWADELPLRSKEPKAKQKRDLRVARFERALKMLERHESKLRREQKLVKKWREKIRYYQRAFEKKEAAGKEE